MPFPFEVEFDKVVSDIDTYVDSVFGSLESEFLTMPKGKGFVEYPTFDNGFEALKRATSDFKNVTTEAIADVAFDRPILLIVLRCMLGLTPPEWAYCASREDKVEVPQEWIRAMDRRIRMRPEVPLAKRKGVSERRILALIDTACKFLQAGAPENSPDNLHRLDKADTRMGLLSVQSSANFGVPYSMLLYERFLGRPFATHRDSVSELVGNIVESAIEQILSQSGISYRKTRHAERLPEFDQAPDFVIPSEFNPQIIIEAKLTEDDGTARDKVTRIQHLNSLSLKGRSKDHPRFEVVACIGGRGFSVRRQDMKKLIIATRGKVFTQQNMHALVQHTRLKKFRSK